MSRKRPLSKSVMCRKSAAHIFFLFLFAHVKKKLYLCSEFGGEAPKKEINNINNNIKITIYYAYNI